MKKYLLSLGTLALLAFSSCGSDEAAAPASSELDIATPVQNVMVAEFTATWCGPCGAWGKPTIAAVAENYGKKAVKVSFNSSASGDALFVQDASAFAGFLSINAYPSQAINLKKIDAPASVTTVSQLQNYIIGVADAEVAKTPEAVVGLSFAETSAGSGEYTIKTKTKFLKDFPEGKYHVGVFIIQDNIIEAQTGNSATFEHTGVFRKTASNEDGTKSAWGTEIATTEAKNGATFEKTFTVTAPTTTGKLAWVKANMKAVAVIYQMNSAGSRPEAVINCNMVKAKL